MKFAVNDVVWYDNCRGTVVKGYPAYDHNGYSYDIRWDEGIVTHNVWESDLCAD